MQAPLINMDGQQVGTVDLPETIFGVPVNTGLMHQAYVRQMANARQGNHSTLTRGEVRRTTAKMYRQKGTGRARHGSRKAPIFVGGGIAHGPKPRKYTKDMPRKMRQGAIRSALSALARDGQLVFVDGLTLERPSTRVLATMLARMTGASKRTLLLLTDADKNSPVYLSVRNIDGAMSLNARYLNVRDLLNHDRVVVPLAALDVITQVWGAQPTRNGTAQAAAPQE